MRALVFFITLFPSCVAVQAEAGSARDMVTVDARTEQVIKGSLRYLAGKQAGNGSWSADGAPPFPVAITGYVLMAFLATGNLPDEGEYSRNVGAGMQFLLDSVQPDGTFRGADGGQYMYNHGLGTIALAELYGQTKSRGVSVRANHGNNQCGEYSDPSDRFGLRGRPGRSRPDAGHAGFVESAWIDS